MQFITICLCGAVCVLAYQLCWQQSGVSLIKEAVLQAESIRGNCIQWQGFPVTASRCYRRSRAKPHVSAEGGALLWSEIYVLSSPQDAETLWRGENQNCLMNDVKTVKTTKGKIVVFFLIVKLIMTRWKLIGARLKSPIVWSSWFNLLSLQNKYKIQMFSYLLLT